MVFHCRYSTFFRQFFLSLIFAVFLSLYLCPFSRSLASTVVPLRFFVISSAVFLSLYLFSFSLSLASTVVPSTFFVNSSCLLFPLSYFLFISVHSLSYW